MLDQVIDAVNATGYGLTLDAHSRIESTWARVGNLYINRNMIGAVVGVQPFGGEGLLSINTAAIGGNAALLRGEERPHR